MVSCEMDVSDRLAGLDCCYNELHNMMGVRVAVRLVEGAEVFLQNLQLGPTRGVAKL